VDERKIALLREGGKLSNGYTITNSKISSVGTASRQRPLQQVTTGNTPLCVIIGERMAEILKG